MHEAFKEYWESLGCPPLQSRPRQTSSTNNWYNGGLWHGDTAPPFFWLADYRIKGDPNWKVRKKWVNSGFTLPVEEYSLLVGRWVLIDEPAWDFRFEYREAS